MQHWSQKPTKDLEVAQKQTMSTNNTKSGFSVGRHQCSGKQLCYKWCSDRESRAPECADHNTDNSCLHHQLNHQQQVEEGLWLVCLQNHVWLVHDEPHSCCLDCQQPEIETVCWSTDHRYECPVMRLQCSICTCIQTVNCACHHAFSQVYLIYLHINSVWVQS